MYRPQLNLAKGSFLLGCLILLSFRLSAQGCCPAPGTCNQCSGGLSVVNLRYHGFIPMFFTIEDNSSPALFSGVIQPGATISVVGRSNGNFSGDYIYVMIGGIVLNASIRVTCGGEFDPFRYYGLFTMVSAVSKGGGNVCCSSNSGASVPPDIYDCPNDVKVSTLSGCNAVATWTPPTAPGCDVASLTSTHTPGSIFPLGTTKVTYTARGTNNLTTTCAFNVTVTDATPPVVAKVTADLNLIAGSDCKATATWVAPQFSDNCSVVSVTSSHNSGSVFMMGTTTVTYTAKDAAGNTTTSQFKVSVKDGTPPVVSNCPADIVVQAATGCSATATWTPPAFSDACSIVTVTSSHVPGATFVAGSTTVTYTGKDAAGNTAVCTFKVLVKDNNAPSFTQCPADTTLSTTDIGGVRLSWQVPAAADACGTPILSSTHQPGDDFAIGVTTVVYTATDASGNTGKCSFVVTVKQERTKLDVAQLVTPDGNASNDTWIIGNIELYKDNKVTIVDRWGSVIYSESGYDNDQRVWRGRNAQGTVVPSGTYFYTISTRSGKETTEDRGFIEVVR